MTTHNANLVINVFLDPSPATVAGFGTVLLLVPRASNSLGGARVLTVTSYEDVLTAQTAGRISASAVKAAQAAFTQSPAPAMFKFGAVEATETHVQGLTACLAADSDVYGVALLSRADGDIASVSGAIEASSKKMLFAFQSSGAWAAGMPTGLAGLADRERTIGFWHDAGAERFDVAALVNRLRFDPDVKSAPWHGFQARGVAAYSAMPSAADRLAMIANKINLALPYGGADGVVDPGVNIAGRAVDEIVSADWFSTRLQERTAALVLAHGERGEKIVVDKTGQKKLLAVIESLLLQGVGVGHFVAGQTSAIAEAITGADRDARRLRHTIRGQLATSGRLFTFDCYFSRSPIAEVA